MWGGHLAFPRGCGPFVDVFKRTSLENDTHEVPKGTVIQVLDKRTGTEIYSIEGKALQAEGRWDPETERKHIKDMGALVASCMAKKRGRTKPGYGDVWAAGLRYRYTAPRGTQKMGHVATKKDKSQQYMCALRGEYIY